MGTCSSQPETHIIYPPTQSPYKAAGILFLDGPLALAGVQKHRKVIEGSLDAQLSGFGGRKEDTDIDWVHTAFREVIEELFDVTDVSVALVNQLRIAIPYRPFDEVSGYINMHCSFADLLTILTIASKHIQSPLYKKMPLSLDELLLNRKPQLNSEIGPLALIPVSVSVHVDPDFTEDLKKTQPSRT
jgi:hypothetical protein